MRTDTVLDRLAAVDDWSRVEPDRQAIVSTTRAVGAVVVVHAALGGVLAVRVTVMQVVDVSTVH